MESHANVTAGSASHMRALLTSKRSAAAALGILLLAGCAQAPLQLAPSITVVNKTSRVIAELRYRACDAPTEIWQNFTVPPLKPDQAVAMQFPLACSDLSALYVDGRTAGSQSNVKQQFPFRWDIY